MIEKIVNNLVKNLLKIEIIKSEEKVLYEYGIRLLLTSIFNSIWIIGVAAFLGYPILGVIYILILGNVRTQLGGYHAKSYGGCFVCYNIFFAFSILICKFLSFIRCNRLEMAFIGGVYLLIIYKFAPVPFAKKLDSSEKNIAKKNALGRTALWICIAILLRNCEEYWAFEILAVLGISIVLMLTELNKKE